MFHPAPVRPLSRAEVRNEFREVTRADVHIPADDGNRSAADVGR
jgi:hypothetical protein